MVRGRATLPPSLGGKGKLRLNASGFRRGPPTAVVGHDTNTSMNAFMDVLASATARPSLCEEARVAFERPTGRSRGGNKNQRQRPRGVRTRAVVGLFMACMATRREPRCSLYDELLILCARIGFNP